MKKISSTQRAHVHTHIVPTIKALFDTVPNPADVREAARSLGIEDWLPCPQCELSLSHAPDVLQASEAGKRYSLKGAQAGNSDPDLSVVSDEAAY
jgi:hypothetical protein